MSSTKRQRIVLITRSLQMGGAERHTVSLADSFAALGHDVHILLLKRRRVIEPDPRVHVHVLDIDKLNRLTGIGLIYDLFTRIFLAPLIPGSGFFWRGFYTPLYFRWWIKGLEKKLGPVDKILAVGQGAFENLWRLRDPRLYQLIVSPFGNPPRSTFRQRLYSKALYGDKNLVVNSSGTEASLRQHLSCLQVAPRTLTLIRNPIPVEHIQSLANEMVELPADSYLVHVGRLTYQKNQELLLRAYRAAHVPEKLVIVGSGQEDKKLRALAAELGIADQVLFVGQQSNPYPWMKHARLFILSSHIEGFGLVMAESLACGTPVVAVDCPGGVRDVLIEEQARFITEPTVDGLAAGIRHALAEPPQILPHWYNRFDSALVAAQFLELKQPS